MGIVYLILAGCVLLLWAVWPRKVTVTRIVDGDSLEVRRGKRRIRVRIAGLDAPEYRQPGGRASLRFLEELIDRRTVRICIGRQDAYGRLAARCLVDGTPINWLMIRAGHAWPTSFFGLLLSLSPRIRRRGIWGDPNRLHPSHWRRLYAHRHPGVILD